MLDSTTSTATIMDAILLSNNTSTAASAVGVACNQRDSSTAIKSFNGTVKSVDNRKSTTSTVNTTPTHKTFKANIFSWLKTSTATSVFGGGNIDNSTNRSRKENNCCSSPPLWMRPRNTSPDVTPFREYRGVQSLRHLWNKRINANAEAVRLGNINKGKLTKSVSCLINEKENESERERERERENEHNNNITIEKNNFNSFQRNRPNRAQSLHDCRPFGIDSNIINDSDSNNHNNNDEFDILHRVKDNFYKYKTAEQASVHLVREVRARAKPKSATTNNSSVCNGNTNFPAFTKCEFGASHINWPKRNDINIAKHRTTEFEKCTISANSTVNRELQTADIIMTVKDKKSEATNTTVTTTSTTILSEMNDVISDCDSSQQTNTSSNLEAEAKENNNDADADADADSNENADAAMERKEHNQNCGTFSTASSDTDTLTTPNTPQHLISSVGLAEQKRSTTRSKQRSAHIGDSAGSKRSANSSPSSNGSRRNTARRTASNGSVSAGNARKYSFKTHSRNYLIPRKMHVHRDGGVATSTNGASGTAVNIGSTGSIVAKLTQQFNEIIQKDKTLLKEIKRKNGVLLTRGCHVYKVIDTNNPHQHQHHLRRNNSNSSPTISRTSSRGSRDLTASPTSANSSPYASVVKKTIKKFELNSVKPPIPVKNLRALQQKKTIPQRNNQETKAESNNIKENENGEIVKLGKGSGKRSSLNLPLSTQQSQLSTIETQNTLNLKKQTHTILLSPQTLEVVKEEARTPIENEEKRLGLNENNEKISISSTNENQTEPATCDPKGSRTNQSSPNKSMPITSADTSSTGSAKETIINSPNPEEKHFRKQSSPMLNKYDAATSESFDCSETSSRSSEAVDAQINISTKQRYKKKCAKIYEKFRFFSPFDNSNGTNGKVLSVSMPISTSTEEPSSTQNAASAPQNVDNERAVSKLYDALEACNEKLKDIADSAIKTSVSEELSNCDENKCSDDDFESRILPNSSFIHHSCSKQQVSTNNQMLLPQAVNVTLINSIEGEQMIMEQKELQTHMLTSNGSEAMKKKENPCSTPDCSVKFDETIYESINTNEIVVEKTEPVESLPKSFLFKCQQKLIESAKTSETADDIYQTVEEVQQLQQQSCNERRSSITSLNDYESIAGSSEQATERLLLSTVTTTTTTTASAKVAEDGYEICEPPTTGSSSTISTITTSTTMVRNTTDELPELPKPKRRLPKSPMPKKRPPTKALSKIPIDTPDPPITIVSPLIEDIDDQHYYADDENIYDTIKGSHCYESLHANNSRLHKTASMTSSVEKNTFENAPTADSVSLTSNCYESITHYRRVVLTSNNSGGGGGGGGVGVGVGHTTGSSSGSTLTISSDHKTNSLYEAPLLTELLFSDSKDKSHIRIIGSSSNESADDCSDNRKNKSLNLVGSQQNIGNGNIAEQRTAEYGIHQATISSDNSDEWIDVSESDADDNGKQQFIVVRERQKIHRSPDWSKRVRDKRLQNTKSESCIEDDSDHYYETLSPLGGKRHLTQQPMHNPQSFNNGQEGNIYNDQQNRKAEQTGRQQSKKYYGLAHGLGNTVASDDYDSFDSSIDEIFDGGQNGLQKDYNDSGVDIRNVKLPEPPPATNQVYAIVKKLKKFISNKKSPNSGSSKSNGSQQKLYENSSQFYVEENIYRNTPKSKSMPKLNLKKSPALPPSSSGQEDYENSEFHTPANVLLNTLDAGNNTSAKSLSNSEKNLSGAHVYQTNPKQHTESATLRSKSKSGKSLRSRIQKSLAGSSPETKNTSLLTSTRSTFYIEDPSIGGYGELDSGFSEKASSGDLPEPTPESQKFSTVARKTKKEAKSSQRRRTVIGLRPNDPPPPPPDDAVLIKTKHERSSTTSWYAECGVFKSGNSILPIETLNENSLNTSKNTIYNQSCSSSANNSSWYAEAGLYQTSGNSVASSSGSSGVSTGNEAGLGDDIAHSFFMNEPLYQIYNAAKLESITRDMEDNDSSTDGYEEIGQNANISDNYSKRDEDRLRRPRLSALQLVGPKAGPARTLWSEIPEVINSCVLMTLTPRERALQEAKFEILTSEASYLKSLNLLRSHFMNHPVFRDTNIVNSRDRKALFSNIIPVHECSERLLTELESCWQDNIMLLGLSDRIYSVAEKSFRVYIDFCEHQGRMDRTLRRLKDTKGIFCQNLELLESSPTCCGLNLHSFLMLPMQRITRLPLLIDAVFSKVSPNDDEYESWKMTLAIMNKIVAQCNEAANRCEQTYEIERISRQLEFPSTIRALAIAPVGVPATGSKPRYLVKKGELTHLVWRGDDAKLTFGRKITKSTIFAFLFSDLLVLAKRKSEEQFSVFDYCPRNMLTITSGNALPQLPTKDLNQTGKNLILMTLLENYEQKTVELVLSCPSVSEQERWLQTMRLPESETPGEKLYEEWDCPQVITKHVYKANEPDALDLDVGDVVNVMRKLPDGWYQGERIRDGATGWFPGSYTEEVNSAHVRARNLKQRHRLLTFTATYLETRKQK